MNRKSFIRRIEVQIGIILGVVMFSVLGVFLGIRKGEERHQESAVLTKVEDETSDILNLKGQEQAQVVAPRPEEPVQPGKGVVARTGEAPLAQEAPSTPTAGIPALGEEGKAVGGVLPPPALTIPLPATHTVKAKDTLIAIARQYYGDDSKWPLIREANRLPSQNALVVGQKLTIPSLKEGKVERQIVKVSTSRAQKASPGRAHRARQGETLYSLARTYYGDESQWKKIYNANQDLFSVKEALEPGDVLVIP